MAPKKKIATAPKKVSAPKTEQQQPKPVTKSLKRRAVEEEIDESDQEDFGNVAIDMGSSDEEETGDNDQDDENTEAFPEISLSDDEEDDEDFQADSEDLEDDEEEEDEYMAGDSLDEADLDEELERELEKEQQEEESDNEDGFKLYVLQ
jgi:hypothetical protein